MLQRSNKRYHIEEDLLPSNLQSTNDQEEKPESKEEEFAKNINGHESKNFEEQSKKEKRIDEVLLDQTILIKHGDAKIETNVPIQVPYTNPSKGEPLQKVINLQNGYVEEDALVDPNIKIRSHSNDCVGLNIPKASNSRGGKNSHHFYSSHETNSRGLCQFYYHEKHIFNSEGCIDFAVQNCQSISIWDPGDRLSWIKGIQKHDFGPSTLATLAKGSAYGFGGEKDIIMSTVRTNKIGFLSDWSHANTVLVHEPFWLRIGSMLVKTDSVWKELAKNAI
ncbi:hypothetical protein SUGI_0624060 [Cryptomeria japonica]|nr:hypothetical protein SUGI_0624060 [Cryptomeria japonica]